MTAGQMELDVGDIVKVIGNDREWKIYWIYKDGQIELINNGVYIGYPESVSAAQLILIRKGGSN